MLRRANGLVESETKLPTFVGFVLESTGPMRIGFLELALGPGRTRVDW